VNVGAAPTPREVIEFFHAIGIPLAELWGMSETSGYGTCNPPERIKIGTVGPPAPGAEIQLADDGEVLIRGPFIMTGYRNQPDKTSEAIDDHGWLHTGDIGELDEDNYLRLVDRKKELIINAGGKNMSPANIEAKIKASSPVIGQAIAIGDGKPFNVALITLDPDVAPAFEKQQGHDALIAAVARGIEAANEQMARVEQIKKYKLLDEEWQPGGDELTPTMKLKRKPINEKYRREIDELYA
jgi:long-subunit acyl-CoA synthetase (AMP-forming)